MANVTLYERGFTAARSAYMMAVKSNEGPSAIVKAVLDAYLAASQRRTEKKNSSELLNDMPTNVRNLVVRVAFKHGLDPDFVVTRHRRGMRMLRVEYAECRREIFIALRNAGYSFPRIGIWFDRDHSSIQHSVKNGPARSPYIHHNIRKARA